MYASRMASAVKLMAQIVRSGDKQEEIIIHTKQHLITEHEFPNSSSSSDTTMTAVSLLTQHITTSYHVPYQFTTRRDKYNSRHKHRSAKQVKRF